MITIYWHCLGMTEADETFVNGALQELSQHLREDPKDDPVKLSVSIKQLGDEPELVREVNGALNQQNDKSGGFSYYVAKILGIFSCHVGIGRSFSHMRLLVYCRPDGHIAVAAKSEAARMKKPPPCWGAAKMPLAAVYSPGNKVAVWHEGLHLLGLDDCYEEDNPRKKKTHCKLDGCIMEYAPPESTCESWPFLCDHNIERLQELAKEME